MAAIAAMLLILGMAGMGAAMTESEFQALDMMARSHDPEIRMKTPEIIQHWGYPFEEHHALTKDGYILTLHRIPRGRNGKTGGPVVFFQHGLEDSSAAWVMNPPEGSAAFLFADAGFDVWLGNVRGNMYSRNHTTNPPTKHPYWHFTFAEMIQYDLDAMIDKALEVASQPSLYYVGHSQGTLIMFGKLSRDEAFAKKIRKFFALAPVGTVNHIKGAIKTLATLLSRQLEAYYSVTHDAEFTPDTDWNRKIAEDVCDNDWGNALCKRYITLQMGISSTQWNQTRIPVYLAHNPAGTSLRNIVHWTQMVRSGQFRDYDYRFPWSNFYHYGRRTPPVYDVSKITTETHLYWSEGDWLATGEDVKAFLLKNLNVKSLMANNEMKDYNHVDFIWGMRAPDEIYRPIMKLISQDHPSLA